MIESFKAKEGQDSVGALAFLFGDGDEPPLPSPQEWVLQQALVAAAQQQTMFALAHQRIAHNNALGDARAIAAVGGADQMTALSNLQAHADYMQYSGMLQHGLALRWAMGG